MFNVFLVQVRSQTRSDSTRSYESHSSSTISSDAALVNRSGPPPVALKPAVARPTQPLEDQSAKREQGEEEDPANKSFLGKVCSKINRLFFPLPLSELFLFFTQ